MTDLGLSEPYVFNRNTIYTHIQHNSNINIPTLRVGNTVPR